MCVLYSQYISVLHVSIQCQAMIIDTTLIKKRLLDRKKRQLTKNGLPWWKSFPFEIHFFAGQLLFLNCFLWLPLLIHPMLPIPCSVCFAMCLSDCSCQLMATAHEEPMLLPPHLIVWWCSISMLNVCQRVSWDESGLEEAPWVIFKPSLIGCFSWSAS